MKNSVTNKAVNLIHRIEDVIVFMIFLTSFSIAQGELLRHQLVTTVTTAQFDSILKAQHVPKRLAPIRYDVAIYEIQYATRWHDGSAVMASGLVLVPLKIEKPCPLLAYAHGTRLQKFRAFSIKGEEALGAFYATDGYAVIIPDFLGLGSGEKRHLYHHAESEATCVVDMVKAAKQLYDRIGTKLSDQLFLTGYSQGGHVAMATHRYIQNHPAQTGLNVTASVPMSGAYDLAGVQGELMFQPYEYPGYLPYLLFSFQEVYHMAPDSSAYLQPKYYEAILPMFDGTHKLRDMSAVLPAVPAEALRPELIQAFKADPNHPMHKVMKENSVIDWKPEAPVLMCYCKGDEQVNYRNAIVAEKTMQALGAQNVKAKMAGRRFRHGPCALYTSLYAKMWLDSIRDGSTKGKKGPVWNRFLISLSKLRRM